MTTTIRATLATAAILATATIASAQGYQAEPRGRNDRQQAACPTIQPGPAWTCHGGGWLPPGLAPTPAPIPVAPEAPRPSSAIVPPSADEWVSFDPYGAGTPQQIMVRTADRDGWFKGGRRYRHIYGYELRIGRVEYRCEELGYGEVCDLFQIGTITSSVGEPKPGDEIPFRMFAPKGPWQDISGR